MWWGGADDIVGRRMGCAVGGGGRFPPPRTLKRCKHAAVSLIFVSLWCFHPSCLQPRTNPPGELGVLQVAGLAGDALLGRAQATVSPVPLGAALALIAAAGRRAMSLPAPSALPPPPPLPTTISEAGALAASTVGSSTWGEPFGALHVHAAALQAAAEQQWGVVGQGPPSTAAAAATVAAVGPAASCVPETLQPLLASLRVVAVTVVHSPDDGLRTRAYK